MKSCTRARRRPRGRKILSRMCLLTPAIKGRVFLYLRPLRRERRVRLLPWLSPVLSPLLHSMAEMRKVWESASVGSYGTVLGRRCLVRVTHSCRSSVRSLRDSYDTVRVP